MLAFVEVMGRGTWTWRSGEEQRQGGDGRAGDCHNCGSFCTNRPSWIAA